mgnify:CR=1 FL=1
MEDKRLFTRIQFDANAHLQAADQGWDTHVIDISLHGALVATPAHCAIATDTPVQLILTLSDQQTRIHMQGHVRYAQDGRVGIECDQLDVDSASHLRRLVELNMGDYQLLEREFDSLCRVHGYL